MDHLPGEIVAEILLRLPRKLLFRSNCVSKQWNSIISDPQFGQTYLQRLRSSRKTASFFPAHEINQPPPPLSSSTADEIMASSNGLILSSAPPNWGFITDYKFRVSNPLTKQSVSLPWLSLPCRKWVYGFATRLDSYKVVIFQCAGDPRSMRCTIEIFSSDTGSWTSVEGTITCPSVVFKETEPKAFSHKGILHWFDWRARCIVTYDPYYSPCIFGHIPLPSRSLSGMNLIQLGHENVLKYGEVEEDRGHGHDHSLLVWRLVDYDKGEWCLEQRCPIRLLGYNPVSGLLCHVVKPVAWNDDLFCYICAKGNMVSSVDVWDCKDDLVDLKSIPHTRRQSIFPMPVCPWSSPFYRIPS